MAALHVAAADAASGVFGPADCTAVSGNGGLTVGVNRFGRVSECRWPSPGYYNQITYRTLPGASSRLLKGVAPWHGVMWGVRRENEGLTWLVGPHGSPKQSFRGPKSVVVETSVALGNGAGEVRQVLFVHPRCDVLVMRLEAGDAGTFKELLWFANFSPCTRAAAQVPLADWAIDGWNDFAACTDPMTRTAYHFRPIDPGRYEREYAQGLRRVKAKMRAWTALGEGTWIGCRALGDAMVHCGSDRGGKSILNQAEAGSWIGTGSAVGQCASLIRFRADDVPEDAGVTVVVAFGQDKATVDETLSDACSQGYGQLLAETEEYWAAWLDKGTIRHKGHMHELLDRRDRSLLTLAMCTDARTGGVVRAPLAQPPLALDWPRHCAWATPAFDCAGRHGMAAKHDQFYLAALDRASESPLPLGAMAAASLTDGREGMPNAVVDVQAPAWVLWSFAERANAMDESVRRAYLSAFWNAVDSMGSFLTTWSDARTGAPLYSFEPKAMREVRSPELTVAVYLGIKSALSAADVLGQPRPEWRQRLAELEPIVLSECFKPGLGWLVRHPLEVWLLGVIAEEDPRLRDALEVELAQCEGENRIESAKAACLAALYLEAHPELLARYRFHIVEPLRRTMPHPTEIDNTPESGGHPDSLHAAYCIIGATSLVHAEARASTPSAVHTR